ncbi:MAG: hypothetical protein ACE5OZ_22235 [Candidatus Heimdallarchaeota archaeon]
MNSAAKYPFFLRILAQYSLFGDFRANVVISVAKPLFDDVIDFFRFHIFAATDERFSRTLTIPAVLD